MTDVSVMSTADAQPSFLCNPLCAPGVGGEGNRRRASTIVTAHSTGCEHSVNHVLKSKNGVIEATSSHTEGVAIVKFDKSIISEEQLAQAIVDKVGYKVTGHKRLN